MANFKLDGSDRCCLVLVLLTISGLAAAVLMKSNCCRKQVERYDLQGDRRQRHLDF